MTSSITGKLMRRVCGLLGMDARKRKWQGFGNRADAMIERIALWRAADFPAEAHAKVAVVVTPWLRTDLPFFSIECALRLAAAGCKVSIHWDYEDLFGNAPHAPEVENIARVLAKLPPSIEVIDVPALTDSLDPNDEAAVAAIIEANAVRSALGESGVREFMETRPLLYESTKRHLGRIHHLIKFQALDWVLVPGGIYGTSAGYVSMAERLGIDLTSFDSDPGVLLLSHRGVAAHQADIAESFRLLAGTIGESDRQWMKREAYADLERRMQGNDALRMQKISASGTPQIDCNVLVPLNLRWDSAALSRQRLFPSVREWVHALVQWAEKEPRARICIRQHPGERFVVWGLRSVDDIGAVIAEVNRVGDRVRYVAAEDEVNTYDLLKAAKVVLPFTSTIGLEAAMLGKPVIISTKCYYEGFNFSWNARTVAEYFDLVGKGISDQLIADSSATENAALIHFLTQRCNWMNTIFTPIPADFAKWSTLSPGELWQLPELQDLFQCFATREPLSSIRCRRMLQPPPT